jgi:hypothetical protein
VLELQGQSQANQYGAFPSPTSAKVLPCPVCRVGTVTGLYLLPLSFDGLERVVELRKAAALAKSGDSNKRPRDEDHDLLAESSYLLLSQSRGSVSGVSEGEQQRTGRWTDEEVEYVDYMANAFDQGELPLPHGIKLNEFLGDILLCKSSRLTKKMKNAKLSTRSFELKSPSHHEINHNCSIMSSLQEKFLTSVSSEATQLVLRFSVTKQWRTHFSNLCLQIGYSNLDARDWIASLEEMESRASKAEDIIRKVRRRRMGAALRTDGGSAANPSVFIGGLSADTAHKELEPVLSMDFDSIAQARKIPNIEEALTERQDPDDDFPSLLTFAANAPAASGARVRSLSLDSLTGGRRLRSFSEDFDALLNDLIDPGPAPAENRCSNSPNHSTYGEFLDMIMHFMENRNLPFEHVDIWVPSFMPRDGAVNSHSVDTEQLRLFHAGHATRGDLGDDLVAFTMHEFGVYSDKFSFEPGHGLPGRVYVSGQPSWECRVDLRDVKNFERVGGAKVYGIKTAVGIPLVTPMVGRIVVAFYSRDDVAEDKGMMMEVMAELAQYSPKPKWKLVIDSGGNKGSVDKTELQCIDYKSSDIQDANPFAFSVPSPTVSSLQLHVAQLTSRQNGGCTSPTCSTASVLTNDEEHAIVSLLGEHMPGGSSAGESSSSIGNTISLLPHFISIRLLLLRPGNRRSSQENDMIDILKNSYRAYSKDNRRSGAELATLLAKDWICLKSSFGGGTAPAPVESKPAPEIHQSHVMHPLMSPANTGGPGPIKQNAMSQASHFASRAPAMTSQNYNLDAPGPMGYPNASQNSLRRNSSYGTSSSYVDSSASYHRESFDSSSVQGNSPNIRPMAGTAPKPLPPHPNIVMEQ